MQEVERKILLFFKKAQARQLFCNFISDLWRCFFVAIALATLIEVLSKIIPLYYKIIYQIVIFFMCLLVYFIYTLYKRPSIKSLSLYLDSYGFKERLTTAVELIGIDTEFSRFVKKSAEDIIDSIVLNKLLKPRFDKKGWSVVGAVFTVFLLFVNIHSPKMDEAKRIHAFLEHKKKEVVAVEKLKKEVFKNYRLNKIEKKKIEKIISKLKKEIKSSKTKSDIELAKQKAWFLLSELKKDTKSAQMKLALEKLKNYISNAEKKNNSENDRHFANSNQSSNQSFINKNNRSSSNSQSKSQENQMKNNSPELESASSENSSGSNEKSEPKDASSSSNSSNSENKGFFQRGSKSISSSKNKVSANANTSQVGINNSDSRSQIQQSSLKNISGKGIGASVPKNPQKVQKPSIYTKNLLNIDPSKKEFIDDKQGESKISQKEGIGERGQKLSFDRVFSHYKQEAVDYIQTDQVPSWAREITKRYFESLEE